MEDSLSLLKGHLIKDGKPFDLDNAEYIGKATNVFLYQQPIIDLRNY